MVSFHRLAYLLLKTQPSNNVIIVAEGAVIAIYRRDPILKESMILIELR